MGLKIALIGKSRSGKSSVANYLTEKYGFEEFTFGYGVKEQFHKKYSMIPTYPKPREGYQVFGQQRRKEAGENVWVNYCFQRIDTRCNFFRKGTEFYPSGVIIPICISDVRQPNEYTRCKQEGFIMVRIDSDDTDRIKRMQLEGDTFTEKDLTHDTESHVDTFAVDYTITNDSTIDDLYNKIDTMIDHISTREVKSHKSS